MYNVCVRLCTCTCTCMYILLVHVYCNLVRSDTCTVVLKCRGICKGLYNLDVHVHVCVCVCVCVCMYTVRSWIGSRGSAAQSEQQYYITRHQFTHFPSSMARIMLFTC